MEDFEPINPETAGKTAPPEDSYDLLHKNFSLFGMDDAEMEEESDVKNSGEIYFSANNDTQDYSEHDFDRFTSGGGSRMYTAQTAARTPQRTAGAPARKAPAAKSTKSAAAGVKKTKKKKKKRKNSKKSLVLALLIIVFVALLAAVVRIPVEGCMNDILAINRDDTQIRVILDRTMKTSELLDLLDKKGLIYSSNFCKIFSNLLGYAKVREYAGGPYVEREYPAGTYYLSPSMGVEGMLREIYTSGQEKSTVKITFPEGYTIDQIVDKLALNGVASKNALYEVINSESFYEKYEFLEFITDKAQRYRALEGYLYPDTYQFYVGENPESVINRFLTNFEEKWNANYAKLAENSDYTIDQIITVASILQKEAADAEQMGVIASIIYNRLESSSFPYINCDSTAKYISAHEEELKAAGSYVNLMMHYDTYQVNGLPVGPICNPGADAIAAALSPEDTDFYYFLHDANGKMYTARTVAEHQANQQYLGN